MTPSHAYYHYTTARGLIFIQGFDAIGADFGPFAIYLCPLEIRIASRLGCRIIMASQEFASRDHNRTFSAHWTLCHKIYIL